MSGRAQHHDFFFVIPTVPSTMPGTPEGAFIQSILVEQMTESQTSSLPETLPGPSHLCASLHIHFAPPPLWQFQQELMFGIPDSPSDFVFRGSWLLLPPSPAFQEIVRFHMSQGDQGKQLLGWTREPHTHLPGQPCAYGRGRRGFGLSPLQPCPPRWATGWNLGVPREGEWLGGQNARVSCLGKEGREGGRGGDVEENWSRPGSSQGSCVWKTRVFQSCRG